MNEKVAKILSARYPGYQKPVRQLWAWNRDAKDGSLQLAEELARGLKTQYPDVLLIRYELAFALVRQKRLAEAIRELQEAARLFPILDEDCLSLLGRCRKDDGDELLEKNLRTSAELAYGAAEEWYEKAYELRHDRFPGMNVAALRLIRASVLSEMCKLEDDPAQKESLSKQAQVLVGQSQQRAKELLANRQRWERRLPDDDIWILATEADAHLILQEWDAAAELYRRALSQPTIQPYHPQSIQAQVVRLLAAFRRLDIVPQGSLANAAGLFSSVAAL